MFRKRWITIKCTFHKLEETCNNLEQKRYKIVDFLVLDKQEKDDVMIVAKK